MSAASHTTRTDFEAGFGLLGLSAAPNAAYPGAKQYAQKFKRCSVLSEGDVTYSSNSVVANSVKNVAKK